MLPRVAIVLLRNEFIPRMLHRPDNILTEIIDEVYLPLFAGTASAN